MCIANIFFGLLLLAATLLRFDSYTCKDMVVMTAQKGKKRQRRNRPVTIYGRFLQWVQFRYGLTQEGLAEVMGTSQSTISNWMIGEYEASWKANSRMADELKFDKELRELSASVFTYGQGTPAPVEDPPGFPYSLASEVMADENGMPDEPGLTKENISKIEAKKREKEERDEQTRRERDAHDTGDRTL